ncbi:UDP-2,4-diacetamido-2,4,6-trideoxy-beta-L-altropyranose hydrolase [Pedobacter sp. ok626]|uniref:UDP-2,4-diacetamido-2,4, 6-trideoxy-beta-L-altropyranose hydrolase n=1 Tax=Pedobacter sp. ok626 TaxID=1761882 RepID=UPI0008905CE0|nr:UDP-2,4-diacetamido-2,4,6-trideoxy-beta-L-altropyranose hydrolase [Pedobacter sp. ok626]SDJ32813.1 UDP-2,4-diacetamido-2,4,6-trideoxy-beta-L-altropyranose hydrolase [Pedobacter sp. ok626]
MKKIYFRADANTALGLGHVTRCMALAQMLYKDFNLIFVSKEIPSKVCEEILALGFKLVSIDQEAGFLKLLTDDDIVVLDHYDLSAVYQKNIKDRGCRLVCIDDLADKEFYADLIINHAPHVQATNYKAQLYTQFALGLDYALLRPTFLLNARIPKQWGKIKSVLVCFGGSDSKNLTQKVTDLLKVDRRFTEISVVVGAAYAHFSDLDQQISTDHRFRLHHNISAMEMVDLMQKSDLVIVPASGILQEAICLGCHIVSGMYVENQMHIFDGFKKKAAFISADDFSKPSIKRALDRAFTQGSFNTRQLIDGKSGARLLKYFRQFDLEGKISIRRATITDLDKTYQWANSSEIRKYFINTEPVALEQHIKWFTAKVGQGGCHYFIGEIKGEIFGSIRFDRKEDSAEVSYLIDEAHQGQGLGVILLKKGLEEFIIQTPQPVKTIKGIVLESNLASIKVFQKLGYQMEYNAEKKHFLFTKVIRD